MRHWQMNTVRNAKSRDLDRREIIPDRSLRKHKEMKSTNRWLS